MHRLAATVPAARLEPYRVACLGTDVSTIHLYRWAAEVALAVFDDLAVLEVAMRSAMARELAAAHGIRWYRRTDLLDDETLKLVDGAWRVGGLGRSTQSDEVVHGKLVASLTGERSSDGTTVRLPLSTAHETLIGLAGYVDRGLESWLRQHSRVDALLGGCPLRDLSHLRL